MDSEPDSGVSLNDAAEDQVSLDAPQLLRRLSLDLRGTLPAEAALRAVAADPSLVDTYRDIYLEDPLFETRLVQLA